MEGEKTYPHMCGGVLATVLLSHRRDKSPTGCPDPLSQNNFLVDLAKIVKPGFESPAEKVLKTIGSEYVNCRKETSGTLPFAKETYIESFRRQMKESYPLLLHRMDLFLHKYVDVDDQDERKIIIQEIFNVAGRDPDCRKSWLSILPDGGQAALGQLTDIHFQPFILGIWFFIVSHRVSNRVENHIFDEWKAARGRVRLRGNVILDSVPVVSEEENLEEFIIPEESIPQEIEEPITNDEPIIMDAPTEEESVKDQTLISHNGRIYNQHAEKIVNIEHLDVLNL